MFDFTNTNFLPFSIIKIVKQEIDSSNQKFQFWQHLWNWKLENKKTTEGQCVFKTSCWWSYLRFKHGAAVHRVGCRSSLPLLSFALNFYNQNIKILMQEPSQHQDVEGGTSRILQSSKQSLTFQVVVCYKTQRHHEGQFLKERNSFIIRTSQ